MISLFGGILTIILVAIVVTLLLAPLETLQAAHYPGSTEKEEENTLPQGERDAAPVFVVFVSGIGSISGDALLEAETRFLDRLDAAVPDARIVRDVFPYAPSGRPLLTGQRVFSGFWRLVGRMRAEGSGLLGIVLNLRNLYQVMVSADSRYGPLYSNSIAHIAADRLRAAGYSFGSGTPIVLLGSSGGAQISAGAAQFLGQLTGGHISIVTFGGIMSSDPGLTDVDEVVSYYGDSDPVYRLGRIVFPGRWPVLANSVWNRALADGTLHEISIGGMVHSGAGGYLDPADWHSGQSRLDVTVSRVAQSVTEIAKAKTAPL
ncbi:MAG: hypothetical protein AAGF74_02100 [Pseudomonadota bacterium]